MLDSEPIRLLLVDCSRYQRTKLKENLNGFIEFEIVGESDTLSEAVLDCVQYAPHIVLLNLENNNDHYLPEGADLLKNILGIKLVVLCNQFDKPMKQRVLRIQAQGIGLLPPSLHHLVRGLKEVAMGIAWVDSRIPDATLMSHYTGWREI